MTSAPLSRLVHIPRHLLHVGLDDLARLGVPRDAHDALRALLADLPLVPDAASSAQLMGPPEIALPCLAVLARHVGQGLRDRNLAIAHDRKRLAVERAKLVFLSADALVAAVARGDTRAAHEAVLFVTDAAVPIPSVLKARDAAGLATFVTAASPIADLAHWRRVDLCA